jgi:hypothetical protein
VGVHLLPLQGGGREGDAVLADHLRVLNETHLHPFARRGAISFLHPFGGEKVHRTFSSIRLTPLKGRVSLSSSFHLQLDFTHATAVSVKPF